MNNSYCMDVNIPLWNMAKGQKNTSLKFRVPIEKTEERYSLKLKDAIVNYGAENNRIILNNLLV